MRVLLLTGPPASGKNTIAELLARRCERCTVIDVDALRQMVYPYKAPWEGEDGPLQQALGVQNACALVRNFVASGYDVVVSDTVSDATLQLYREQLPSIDIWTVLLLPTEEEIHRRLMSRVDYLSRGEVEMLYAQQQSFEGYDNKIDNTDMSPDEAVNWLTENWSNQPVS